MSNLSGFVKRIRDIMRNDAGINGDAQRIEQMAWMLFLKVYDAKGAEKTGGNICTGDKIKIFKTDDALFMEKNIIVYGDVSGDGKISIIDLANVQKHLLKVKLQEGNYMIAADTNKDGKISIIDLANVQKHILKVKNISQ